MTETALLVLQPHPWPLSPALSYEELSCERGWMAQGLIKSIDLLFPALALAAPKDLIDGSCPRARCAGGPAIKHTREGVDTAGGAGQQAGSMGEEVWRRIAG